MTDKCTIEAVKTWIKQSEKTDRQIAGFFNQSIALVMKLRKEVKEEESSMRTKGEKMVRSAPVAGAVATPGRNEKCPCGSGKKYKKCHEGFMFIPKEKASEYEAAKTREKKGLITKWRSA